MKVKSHSKTVFCIANVGDEVGLGHLYRLFGIQSHLSLEFVFILPAGKNQEVKNIISGFGLKYFELNSDFNSSIDEIISLVRQEKVILDGYNFSPHFFEKLYYAECTSVGFLDFPEQSLFVNRVVNAHSIPMVQGKHQFDQEYSGWDYILLRKSFYSSKKSNFQKSIKKDILLCFGGTDPFELLEKYLPDLSEQEWVKSIQVIISDAFSQSRLSNLKGLNEKIFFHVGISDQEIVALTQEVDFAIATSSGISFELISANCLLFTGTIVDNQSVNYLEILKNNVGIGIGEFQDKTSHELIDCLLSNLKDEQLINNVIDNQNLCFTKPGIELWRKLLLD